MASSNSKADVGALAAVIAQTMASTPGLLPGFAGKEHQNFLHNLSKAGFGPSRDPATSMDTAPTLLKPLLTQGYIIEVGPHHSDAELPKPSALSEELKQQVAAAGLKAKGDTHRR